MNKKIDDALDRIRTCLSDAKEPYMLFWPDRRSILCIYLLHKNALKTPSLLYVDTGQMFDEVYLFGQKLRKLWRLNVVQRIYVGEHNVSETPGEMECCHARKANMLTRAISDLKIDLLITGIKPDLLKLQWNCPLTIDAGTLRVVNPVLDLSDDEIVRLSEELNLPRCSVRTRGLEEIDCRPCTSLSDLIDVDLDKQEVLQRLKSLGYC